MYEGNGERITLYCSKLAEANSTYRYSEIEPVAAVQWIDGGYAWVVSGPANKMRLKGIARAAYDQQLDRAPPTTRSSAEPLVSRRGG